MWIDRILLFAGAGALLAVPQRTIGQDVPASGLYQIVSGSYVECCGLAGPFRRTLPLESQRFIQLDVDPSKKVTMTFLGSDMKTTFRVVTCGGTDPVYFTFDFGFPFGTNIIFHADPGPPPNHQYYSYSVGFGRDSLRVDGTVGIVTPFCADVPTQFSHSNVVAVLMPNTTVRVSEVEVCWDSNSNRTYQVQYRSALTTNVWMNLGAPVPGAERRTCVTDKIVAEEPKRFYRVVIP